MGAILSSLEGRGNYYIETHRKYLEIVVTCLRNLLGKEVVYTHVIKVPLAMASRTSSRAEAPMAGGAICARP